MTRITLTKSCKNHTIELRQETTNTGNVFKSADDAYAQWYLIDEVLFYYNKLSHFFWAFLIMHILYCSILPRLVLRCRAVARARFAAARSDVLVKLELLDNKHVQDIVLQLRRLMSSLTAFHLNCHTLLNGAKLFPIEVDLTKTTFIHTRHLMMVCNFNYHSFTFTTIRISF